VSIQSHYDHADDKWKIERRSRIAPAVWERRDMRIALAARDIRAVYGLLQRYGVSQRLIAALTDQSQSEVSEILAGRRRVVSYELLTRIADGLGVPRGWMGLASDLEPPAPPDASQP
jgi:antitoxin component HigA of HigAB toxin-antitoxin module